MESWRDHRRGVGAVLAGFLAAAVVVGTAACSEERHAASPVFEPGTKGTLTVATELPVRGFWDGDDPATVNGGFEWGLAKALADSLKLGLTVREVPFADIVSGRFDGADIALAQVSATDERKRVAELTVPYYASSPAVLARRGTEDDLVDLATAKAQHWVVQKSTTLESYLEDVVRPDAEPLVLATTDAVVRAVVDGEADAALLDLPTALAVANEDGMSVPARFDHPESIVGVMPAHSTNVEVVDQVLERLIADGTVDGLRKQWLDPVFAVDPDHLPVITAEE